MKLTKELKNFNPYVQYGGIKTVDSEGVAHWTRNGYEYPIMENTLNHMMDISNLITDMASAGASDAEIARAVKHSMVVIDAEKLKLDYKQSEIDNDIPALKKKYQTS